ncbi:hypothetical protein [Streptomyces sp. NPDC059761]|uniref:hypothetical protein n=1 Tax=Streptomyces sp. NPDC059761 TaxID=3346937 RepID=UPI00364984BF
MVANHARKNVARGRHAVEALRSKEAAERVVFVPYPRPDLDGAAPCTDCHGVGLGDGFYEHPYETPTPGGAVALVVETFCGTCLGCGRAAHSGCRPDSHATYEEDEFVEDWDEEEPTEPDCHSCRGRTFSVTQGAGEETAASIEAHELLMARAAKLGFSEWDIRGAYAFGELDQMLGEGSQELATRSDTTVWLRMPCGCREAVSVTVRRDQLAESMGRS